MTKIDLLRCKMSHLWNNKNGEIFLFGKIGAGLVWPTLLRSSVFQWHLNHWNTRDNFPHHKLWSTAPRLSCLVLTSIIVISHRYKVTCLESIKSDVILPNIVTLYWWVQLETWHEMWHYLTGRPPVGQHARWLIKVIMAVWFLPSLTAVWSDMRSL